jgi:voltage-gated potassium channel
MNSVFFLALRRLRTPLILMIIIFAVSTAGLALIPGRDAAGDPVHLSIFQAFYFVSYTATTIGFGEIPFSFSDAQRLWVTFIIFSSVMGWTYLIGGILRLAQDDAFQQAITSTRFTRQVERLREPFFIVCGVGETGLMVVKALDHLGFRAVVIDREQKNVQELELEDLSSDPPSLCADARIPDNVVACGIHHPRCLGILVLTNDDETNLAVALTVHLVNPSLKIIARCKTPEVKRTMLAIGVHEIINPFSEFSRQLLLAMNAPNSYRLAFWLSGLPRNRLRAAVPVPPGHWIVCGHGRFGREIVDALQRSGFKVRVIDPSVDPALEFGIAASGDDMKALLKAGLEDAIGVVAGTDDDVTNLTIGVTARFARPEIFLILRQNLLSNRKTFEVSGADMTMVSSTIIANRCIAGISTPLLSRFLEIVKQKPDEWAASLVEELQTLIGDETPHFWSVGFTPESAPGLVALRAAGTDEIPLAALRRDFADRDAFALLKPLLLLRDNEQYDRPDESMLLQPGDRILFTGTSAAESSVRHIVTNVNVADYVVNGRNVLGGLVWRMLDARRETRS